MIKYDYDTQAIKDLMSAVVRNAKQPMDRQKKYESDDNYYERFYKYREELREFINSKLLAMYLDVVDNMDDKKAIYELKLYADRIMPRLN